MESEIRAAIVGAGANTRERHIPGLRCIDEVEIVGVVNRSSDSTSAVADSFGIEKRYSHWREAIADPETNAIVIGTWPYMHAPVTLAALESGKHVLCEARMAMNAAEAKAMLAAARSRPDLVAQVVPAPISLGVDAMVRKLVADGALGDILAIEVKDCGGFLDKSSPLHWRQDFDLSGMNTMTLGIWYETVMRWVGEAVEVSAMGKTFVKSRKDHSGYARAVLIPEHIDVVADMAIGAQAHFQVSRATGLMDESEAWVSGSEATLRFADGNLYIGRRGGEMAKVEIPSSTQGSWRVEQDFVDSIRTGKPVTLTSFEDGAKYMEFTEAVFRSRQEHRSIPLPLTSL